MDSDPRETQEFIIKEMGCSSMPRPVIWCWPNRPCFLITEDKNEARNKMHLNVYETKARKTDYFAYVISN